LDSAPKPCQVAKQQSQHTAAAKQLEKSDTHPGTRHFFGRSSGELRNDRAGGLFWVDRPTALVETRAAHLAHMAHRRGRICQSAPTSAVSGGEILANHRYEITLTLNTSKSTTASGAHDQINAPIV
jgi:hypothetical protein